MTVDIETQVDVERIKGNRVKGHVRRPDLDVDIPVRPAEASCGIDDITIRTVNPGHTKAAASAGHHVSVVDERQLIAVVAMAGINIIQLIPQLGKIPTTRPPILHPLIRGALVVLVTCVHSIDFDLDVVDLGGPQGGSSAILVGDCAVGLESPNKDQLIADFGRRNGKGLEHRIINQ